MQPLISTFFPYTTLFRSRRAQPLDDFFARVRVTFSSPGIGHTVAFAVTVNRSFLKSKVFVERAALRKKAEAHRSEEHTFELQSHSDLVCRLLLEKKKNSVRTGAFDGLPQVLASGLRATCEMPVRRALPRLPRHVQEVWGATNLHQAAVLGVRKLL